MCMCLRCVLKVSYLKNILLKSEGMVKKCLTHNRGKDDINVP